MKSEDFLSKSITIGSMKIPIVLLILIGATVFFSISKADIGNIPLGGTFVSLTPLTFGSDPKGEFGDHAYVTQVQVGNTGGDAIRGIWSSPVKSTDATSPSSKAVTIGFQLNSASCNYNVDNRIFNTLNPLRVEKVQTIETPQGIVGAGCQLDLATNYNVYPRENGAWIGAGTIRERPIVGSQSNTGTIMCKQLTNNCAIDFEQICKGSGGTVVTCDTTVAGWFTNDKTYGRACVKVNSNPSDLDYYRLYTPPILTGVYPYWNISVLAKTDTQTTPEVFTITSDGKTIITKDEAKDFYLDFVGSSVANNEQCPSSNFDLVQVLNSGNAKSYAGLLRTNTYSNLYTLQKVATGLSANNVEATKLLGAVDDYNKNLKDTMTALDQNYKFDKNQIIIDRSTNPPYYQNFRMVMDANWIGVYHPVAVPKITELKTIYAKVGQISTNSITVTNNGQVGAAIELSSTCPITWSNKATGAYDPQVPRASTFIYQSSTVGEQECCFTATSNNFGKTNTDTRCIKATTDKACTNSCPVNFNYDTSTPGSCECVCTLTDADCAKSNQQKDPVTCSCKAPDPGAKCSDGTVVNGCNYLTGEVCERVGTTNTLRKDSKCGMCADGTGIGLCSAAQKGAECVLGSSGPVLSQNLVKCPLDNLCNGQYQHKKTDGTCITCTASQNWNSSKQVCEDDLSGWLLGGGFLLVLGGAAFYFMTKKGGKRRR